MLSAIALPRVNERLTRAGSPLSERIADHDRVLALGAGREQGHRRLDQLLDTPDILDRGRRQLGPRAGAAGAVGPAFEGLVDRLAGRLGRGRGREMVEPLALAGVADADLERREAIEHVEL